MYFSDDDIRMLAEQERKMDAGEIPFVVLKGERVSVLEEVMDRLGLVAGQTINGVILTRILELNLEMLQTERSSKKHMN